MWENTFLVLEVNIRDGYSSKLKESEERNMKRSRKLIGIVIAIQSAQLILWTALQVLLR